MVTQTLTQVRKLRDVAAFRDHLAALGIELAVDDTVDPSGPLAQPIELFGRTLTNRFCILPMEGWDAEADGRPSDLVRRRWTRFGASGADLVWLEATAVQPDAKANPSQLTITPDTVDAIGEALATARAAGDAQLFGLQLTHSGRWCRPTGDFEPRIAYRHPVLDDRVGASDQDVFTDDELRELQVRFVDAARLARRAGFDFVDVKACHGYLLHELLTGHDRPGPFGGDFAGRTRFMRETIAMVREACPDLGVAVRLSAYDLAPHDADAAIAELGGYRYAFGGDGTGRGIDLTEPIELVEALHGLGVELLSVTGGSPYYVPWVQRPAYHPPSDGIPPPRDPLHEVAVMLDATAAVKAAVPEMTVVGTGYTYLQEWLAHVGQRQVADGRTDLVGVGRMALSYPGLPGDVLAGRPLERRLLCRTFSDCTTAPRNGMVSGCYPIDELYKSSPQRARLVEVKRRFKAELRAADDGT